MPGSPLDEIVAFRRRLHAHPELSERENATARAIVERLRRGGVTEIVDRLGAMQTGVCAIYDSGRPGPRVLLRAELDALPIQETNTFAHRSKTPGVSHKCGHDGHMATLLAVAAGLDDRPLIRGRLYLLFQPAEETGKGAFAMLEDARFRALPAPDYVYAFHNVPKVPLGRVLVRDGVFAQGSAGFIVKLCGKTSHSSYPEHGVNPSQAVTQLIDTVNGLDRSFAERASAPVLGTITYAQLGVADKGPNFGTTPGEATVMGVLRAHANDDLELVRAELTATVDRLAETSGLRHSLSWHEAFAATHSDSECTEVITRAAAAVGLEVDRLKQPFRWSEDFGYFTKAYQGAFFGLGSGEGQPQLHDDGYDYPDELIGIGATIYRAIVDTHLG